MLDPSSVVTEEPLGDPESVDALLTFARDVALRDEEERQHHLDSKAGTLAGFVAVALSLEAGLGASVLRDSDLSSTAHDLFVAAFLVGLVCLAASALVALLGVLVPTAYLALEDESLERLRRPSEMTAHRQVLLERQLSTVVGLTLKGREVDNRKASALKLASFALAAGVAGIAAQGLVLAFA